MRTLARTLLALLVALALFSAAPADAAKKHRHKHKAHHHGKVVKGHSHRAHHRKPAVRKATPVTPVAPAPPKAHTPTVPPGAVLPLQPNIGHCDMLQPAYLPDLGGWYLVCT